MVSYIQIYSWEIEQRERFDTGDEIDLKSWTKQQIVEEAQKAYLEVWRQRGVWGSESLGVLGEYLEQNNYPARIRGTLRDAVTYLWVELLSDTSLWQPRQSNELYRLDLERLIAGDPVGSAQIELDDPAVHPLVKIGALLDDLESWHLENDRPEAAFEADRERLSRLHASFSRADDRKRLSAPDLQEPARRPRSPLPVVVGGAGHPGRLGVGRRCSPDSQVRAREIALAGEQAHPGSIGGDRCRNIVAAIEAPGYSLQSMANDGPGKAIDPGHPQEPGHAPFPSLRPRSGRADRKSSEDYNALPGYREVPEIIGSRLPDAGVERRAAGNPRLPVSSDLCRHRRWRSPGLYVVVASVRRDFRQTINREAAVNLIVTDLVLLTRHGSTRHSRSPCARAETGKSLERVQVSLYRFDYRKGHQRVETHLSGADGRVVSPLDESDRNSYFVLAEQRRGHGCRPQLSAVPPSGRAERADRRPRLHRPQCLPATADDPLEGGGLPRRRREEPFAPCPRDR